MRAECLYMTLNHESIEMVNLIQHIAFSYFISSENVEVISNRVKSLRIIDVSENKRVCEIIPKFYDIGYVIRMDKSRSIFEGIAIAEMSEKQLKFRLINVFNVMFVTGFDSRYIAE